MSRREKHQVVEFRASSKGLVTAASPRDIPPDALVECENFDVDTDSGRLVRRDPWLFSALEQMDIDPFEGVTIIACVELPAQVPEGAPATPKLVFYLKDEDVEITAAAEGQDKIVWRYGALKAAMNPSWNGSVWESVWAEVDMPDLSSGSAGFVDAGPETPAGKHVPTLPFYEDVPAAGSPAEVSSQVKHVTFDLVGMDGSWRFYWGVGKTSETPSQHQCIPAWLAFIPEASRRRFKSADGIYDEGPNTFHFCSAALLAPKIDLFSVYGIETPYKISPTPARLAYRFAYLYDGYQIGLLSSPLHIQLLGPSHEILDRGAEVPKIEVSVLDGTSIPKRATKILVFGADMATTDAEEIGAYKLVKSIDLGTGPEDTYDISLQLNQSGRTVAAGLVNFDADEDSSFNDRPDYYLFETNQYDVGSISLSEGHGRPGELVRQYSGNPFYGSGTISPAERTWKLHPWLRNTHVVLAPEVNGDGGSGWAVPLTKGFSHRPWETLGEEVGRLTILAKRASGSLSLPNIKASGIQSDWPSSNPWWRLKNWTGAYQVMHLPLSADVAGIDRHIGGAYYVNAGAPQTSSPDEFNTEFGTYSEGEGGSARDGAVFPGAVLTRGVANFLDKGIALTWCFKATHTGVPITPWRTSIAITKCATYITAGTKLLLWDFPWKVSPGVATSNHRGLDFPKPFVTVKEVSGISFEDLGEHRRHIFIAWLEGVPEGVIQEWSFLNDGGYCSQEEAKYHAAGRCYINRDDPDTDIPHGQTCCPILLGDVPKNRYVGGDQPHGQPIDPEWGGELDAPEE